MTTPPSPAKAARSKSDDQIKTDVLSELRYEPAVKVTDIGVLVKGGVVTLNGSTSSHGEKAHALRAAKRVAGVKTILDEIKVDIPEPHRRPDGEITTAAAQQLDWSTTIPKGSTSVKVRDGWLTLEGVVEWQYQKTAAEDVLQHMIGVKGITNLIAIKPLISVADVEKAIRSAFERNAVLDAKRIEVETAGSTVTLRGKLANSNERDEAERVAWAAPGVLTVNNQITLEWWGLFN